MIDPERSARMKGKYPTGKIDVEVWIIGISIAMVDDIECSYESDN